MHILPDKKIPKVLMPMQRSVWYPSIHVPVDQFGNETTKYRWTATHKYHDGKIAWRGYFNDRDDFDKFVYAYYTNSLKFDSALWRLPNPEYIPGMFDELPLLFAATVAITGTGAGSWMVPGDWTSAPDNSIQVIGGGGSGGYAYSGTSHAHGGGGGGSAYAKRSNNTLTPGTSINYAVGAGGAALSVVMGSSPPVAVGGYTGGNTYFNGTGYSNSMIAASGGEGGRSTITAGIDVIAASGGYAVYTTTGGATGRFNLGGNGGAIGNSFSASKIGSGGGGAGGSDFEGVTVTVIGDGSANSYTPGGAGNGGSNGGGATGSGNGADGGSGSNIAPGYGSGAGGNGGYGTNNVKGGNGGFYGAGGGGTGSNTYPVTTGAGGQGLIYITYTPAPSKYSNIPMLGL